MKILILLTLLSSCITVNELKFSLPPITVQQVEQAKEYGSYIQTGKIEGQWCQYNVFGEVSDFCFDDQASCESDTHTFDGCALR